jgi:hypothetical protein
VRLIRHVRDAASVRGRARLIAGAAASALMLITVPVAARSQSSAAMDPAAFAAELRRISSEISTAEPGRVPSVRVPSVWVVETRAQRVVMPASWLRHGLDAARRDPGSWPTRRGSLLAQLEALSVEAESLRELSRAADPGSARAVLTRVLAGPEFRRMAKESAFATLRQRFTGWLMRIWERLGGTALGSRDTAVVFAWVASGLALIALATWLVRLTMRPETHRRFPIAGPASRRRSARAWARAAAGAADPREVSRCTFHATVCSLEEDGTWHPDDTRTPREYLGLLPHDHRRRGVLVDVTRRFEEIWYAGRTADERDRQSSLARLRELGCLPEN